MRRRTLSIISATALLIAVATGCARDRGTPAPAATASPEGAGATRPPVAPPLESGHAPFLSTLPAGSASPHDHGVAAEASTPLVWDAPAGWIAEPPRNPMRRAQYRLPGPGGADDGECAVFYFGAGQGGDGQGNAARWVSMFTTPDGSPVPSQVSEQKVGTRTVTRIEAKGTYHPIAMTFGGEPPPPQPGWMLLGAVVPGPDANWFFRCTGPEATVAPQKPAFDACIASVREAGS